MTRILAYLLSLYWMLVFAGEAVRAVGEGALGLPPAAMAGMAVPVVHAVVAALFLWLIVALLSDGDEYPGDGADVSRIAFAGALGATAAGELLGTGGQEMATRLAALAASYVLIHMDRGLVGAVSRHGSRPQRAARVMAIGAARDTLLSRIAKPHPADGSGG